MSDLDLDDLGMSDLGSGSAAPRRPRKARRGLLTFLAGLAVGIAATILVPMYLGDYLPGSFRGGSTAVEGEVVGKQREGDRLLLTVETPDGSVLVTFTARVPELDLLIGVGDSLALAMGEYRPFSEDPEVRAVRKPHPVATDAAGPEVTRGGAAAAADTVAEAGAAAADPFTPADSVTAADTQSVGADTLAAPAGTAPADTAAESALTVLR